MLLVREAEAEEAEGAKGLSSWGRDDDEGGAREREGLLEDDEESRNFEYSLYFAAGDQVHVSGDVFSRAEGGAHRFSRPS